CVVLGIEVQHDPLAPLVAQLVPLAILVLQPEIRCLGSRCGGGGGGRCSGGGSREGRQQGGKQRRTVAMHGAHHCCLSQGGAGANWSILPAAPFAPECAPDE